MDPRDRILDYALQQLLRGPLDRDQSSEVRRAWERGIPGPSLEDLDLEELEREVDELDPPTARRARRARGARRRGPRPAPTPWVRTYLPVAAAALLLATLGRWWILREPPEVVASLSRPLPMLVDGRWVPAARDALPLGEPAFVDGRDPLTVGLPGGGELVARPGSLFALVPAVGKASVLASVRLDWGALELRAADGVPLTLTAPGTSVSVSGAARVAARLEWDRDTPAPDALHVIEGTREGIATGAMGRLAVEVLGGDARVETGGRGTRLGTGERQRVALETRGPRVIDESSERVFERQFAELLAMKEAPPYYWSRPAEWPALKLAKLLEQEPTHWLELEERLRTTLTDADTDPLVWEEALYLLSQDGGRVSARLAGELFDSHPGHFRGDVLLALAERGLPRFHNEVEAIVLQYDDLSAERWIPDEDRRDPLMPAAYLALRGNDIGVDHLMAATTSIAGPKEEAELIRQMAAAIALTSLNVEDPYGACVEELERSVREVLARGELEMPVRVTLIWEFFENERANGMRVAYLAQRAAAHVTSRQEALVSPEQVEALLERLGAQ